jgi:myo-inositol-1(or 4)-monophosphatase
LNLEKLISKKMKETLQHALKEAGKILMENFGKISDFTVKESQSSIVTKTDVDSERKIMEIISNGFPNHNLLGEETGFKNQNSEFTWVVDPIDGTSNYAAGIPWFGIIICILKNFEPVVAGCYMPVQHHTYFAEKGKGASLNGKSISVSNETDLKNILAVYSLDFSDDPGKTEHEAKIIQRLVQKVRNLRSTNCLIDLCYTADGKFGAIINQSTKIWDIAGTGLIIEEAGGKVTDLKGNKFDFTLTESNYDRNFEIVGSNKLIHSEVIKLLND